LLVVAVEKVLGWSAHLNAQNEIFSYIGHSILSSPLKSPS
jgi:hypothetical protein